MERFSHPIYRGVFAAALCLCGSAAWAEQAESKKDGYRLPEVTVNAQAAAPEGPFPAEVSGTYIFSGKKASVIDLQEAPAIVNNNFRQTLAKTAGLLLSEESTPLFSVGFRGLDPHRAQFTQVMKDGVPIHADMFGYPEAYYVPPLQSIERIEFVKGGGSLMFGPQPGGALNFITKQPDAGTPFSIYTENSIGTDELFSHYTGLSGLSGPLGYLAYFHEREGNGFRESNSDFEVLGGGLKTTLNQTNDSRVTLSYDEYHEEHGEPGGLTKAVADSDGRDRASLQYDRFRLERYYALLHAEHALTPESLVELRTFGGHYRRYSKRQRGGGFGTAPTGASSSTNAIEEQDFYTFGLEPRLRHTYEAWGQPGQAFSFGALAYFSDSPREDQRGTTPGADTGALRNKSDRETQYLSFFAEHLFRYGPLSVTPGLRLENIWQQLEETVNADKAAVGTPLGNADEYDFVPLLGLGAAYDVAPGAQMYANLSQSYRPKIFSQAIPTGATNIVNNDLEEGKGWAFDTGFRGHWYDALSWDAGYFFMRFDDQIGTAGNTVDNVGDARHQGLELALELDVIGLSDNATGGSLRDQVGSFKPYANLMLLDAKFIEGPQNGKTPQYAPQYTARFGVEYALRKLAKVRLGSTFIDDHFADDANTANRTVPSYKVWDLTSEVSVWKEYVALVGGINNLFDERYYARIRGDGIDPAYERNVYGGVRVGFRF